MLLPKTGIFATDNSFPSYTSLQLVLDSIESPKFGQTGNEQLLRQVASILGIPITAPDLNWTITFNGGADTNTLIWQAVTLPSHILAILQFYRLIYKDLSDDSTLIATYENQVFASTDKLVLQAPAISQSGDNLTLQFKIISIANGGTIDYPTGSTGDAIYQGMFSAAVSIATNGAITIGTFSGPYSWISSSQSGNFWTVVMNTTTTSQRLLANQIAKIVDSGITNVFQQLFNTAQVIAA